MTFQPALPDWAHQAEARRRMWMQRYYALFMEMGTGKTKPIVDEWWDLYEAGEIDAVVVEARKGSYMNWVRTEIELFSGPKRWEEKAVVRYWKPGGGNKTEQAGLMQLLESGPWLPILVINTEALSTGDKAYKFVSLFMRQHKRVYWALDESTSIKNPEAARTKNTIDLSREAAFRRIMTGLPSPKTPMDLYSQAEFLWPGLLGQSWYAFRARYAKLREMRLPGRPRPIVVIDGFKNLDELQDRTKPWSYRVTKDECLDLPPKVYMRRDVELTSEQARIYNEMKEFAIAELAGGGTISSSSVITRMIRLQQVTCGHVMDDTGEVRDVDSNRISILMDVLEEASGKVIIWSRFRPDVTKIVAAITEEYGADSVVQFHGGNSSTRHIDSERFQKDERVRYMVATYAGGHGNTWTAADTVIYYSNSFNLEERMQSEDRAHRAGQTADRVTYVDLVSPGTFDEKVLAALREKIDLASAITGDNYREWLI